MRAPRESNREKKKGEEMSLSKLAMCSSQWALEKIEYGSSRFNFCFFENAVFHMRFEPKTLLHMNFIIYVFHFWLLRHSSCKIFDFWIGNLGKP